MGWLPLASCLSYTHSSKSETFIQLKRAREQVSGVKKEHVERACAVESSCLVCEVTWCAHMCDGRVFVEDRCYDFHITYGTRALVVYTICVCGCVNVHSARL